jgi:BolA family transcriptional regulator, general stress-responsive regulator
MVDTKDAPIKASITRKLTEAFSPTTLKVVDESDQHAHHGHHHHDKGETHFAVEIVSASFEGKSRVERHRLVNALLAEELAARVHALSIAAKAPVEVA